MDKALLVSSLVHATLFGIGNYLMPHENPMRWASLQGEGIVLYPLPVESRGSKIIPPIYEEGATEEEKTQGQEPQQHGGVTSIDQVQSWGNALPPYPEEARRRGWEGNIKLRLSIDGRGQVARVEVLESTGYEILDEESIRVAKGWRVPENLVSLIVPMEFRLTD